MACLVFIGHEASLTGAPYVQLYLLQWMKINTSHTIELILLRGGPLVKEFEKIANVHILQKDELNKSIKQRAFRKIKNTFFDRRKNIFCKILKLNPSIIYANASLSLEFGVELKEYLKIPLILHIHELTSTFFYLNKSDFSHWTKDVDFFISCSDAVKMFYKSQFDISGDKINTIYSFVAERKGEVSTSSLVRQEFKIANKKRVVGSVGTLGWRKGSDLFLQIAKKFKEKGNNDIHFVWVGCNINSNEYKEAIHDINLLNLNDTVDYVTSRSDIRGFYQAFDVFLLTAREDPFPLVCLEAAMQGCPTICFAHAGGMPEFIRDDAGFVVPYGDTAAMAAKIIYLLSHDSERQNMGQTGRRRVAEQHTIEIVGPQLQKVLQHFITLK